MGVAKKELEEEREAGTVEGSSGGPQALARLQQLPGRQRGWRATLAVSERALRRRPLGSSGARLGAVTWAENRQGGVICMEARGAREGERRQGRGVESSRGTLVQEAWQERAQTRASQRPREALPGEDRATGLGVRCALHHRTLRELRPDAASPCLHWTQQEPRGSATAPPLWAHRRFPGNSCGLQHWTRRPGLKRSCLCPVEAPSQGIHRPVLACMWGQRWARPRQAQGYPRAQSQGLRVGGDVASPGGARPGRRLDHAHCCPCVSLGGPAAGLPGHRPRPAGG